MFQYNENNRKNWKKQLCDSNRRTWPHKLDLSSIVIASSDEVAWPGIYRWKIYLPSIAVIVTLFVEGTPAELINDPGSATFLPATKAGCLGSGRATCSFTIMEITSDIVGRSPGLSWTQRSPMFMYLKGMEVEGGSPRVGSIKSEALLELHNFHACGTTTQMLHH